MKRYILTGGTMAFIDNRRVDVGDEFTLPDDVKPPRFSRLVEEGDAPVVPVEDGSDRRTMSEMITQHAAQVRASDTDPVE